MTERAPGQFRAPMMRENRADKSGSDRAQAFLQRTLDSGRVWKTLLHPIRMARVDRAAFFELSQTVITFF